MKGFPNQVAELPKISTAIRVLLDLVDSGGNAKDDGVFGEALVRAGVAGTGHQRMPIEEYLREQRRKPASNQSFRTTARGLRELFRLMGLINDAGARVIITRQGREAAAFAGARLDRPQIEFWRTVIRDMHHGDEDEMSHPYQVLLRLVASKPGITRAKCALALEANDDSAEELERIAALADLEEEDIRDQIEVTESNWNNAKKVLPKFAEQLGDVTKVDDRFFLAASPGDAGHQAGRPPQPEGLRVGEREPRRPRPPRNSRGVTPQTIGAAATAENFDEVADLPEVDPNALRATIEQRRNRLRRHNLVVRALAQRLSDAGAGLFEDPFDILALLAGIAVLVEVKSLDGTPADERARVMEALAQLLYYEAFVAGEVAGEAVIHKIACFESRITEAHQQWLNAAGIGAIWRAEENRFEADALGTQILGAYIAELR